MSIRTSDFAYTKCVTDGCENTPPKYSSSGLCSKCKEKKCIKCGGIFRPFKQLTSKVCRKCSAPYKNRKRAKASDVAFDSIG